MGVVQSTVGSVTGGTGSATLAGVSSANTLLSFVFATSGAGSQPSSTPVGYTVANAPAALSAFGTAVSASIYFNQAPSGGSNTCAVNFTAGGNGHVILVEWSGLLPSALDVAPAAVNFSSAGTSGTTSIASGTLGQANEVVFAFMVENTSGSGSSVTGCNLPATGGFIDIQSSGDSSADWLYDVCYQVTAATTGVTAGWTWTDTAAVMSQTVLASFKIPAPASAVGQSWQQRGAMGVQIAS